ncbi:MAG: hypothetical protein ACRENP_05320 [Longimicrobiales bacterium]
MNGTSGRSRLEHVANLVLISAAAVCLLLLVGIVILQRDMTLPVALLIVFLALITASLGLALRAAIAVKINLCLVLIAIAISVAVAEIVLEFNPQLAGPGLGNAGGAAPRGVRSAVVEYRQRGIPAFPPLHGWQIRTAGLTDPALVIEREGRAILPIMPAAARTTTVLCDEAGHVTVYESDRFGFNNSDDLWTTGEFDVIAIGDSFVHGMCVSESENLVGRLRSRWPLTLNLGISGAGPLIELAVLREYVSSLKAKNVLWFYFEGNDLTDLETERRNRLLLDYLSPDAAPRLAGQHEASDQQVRRFLDHVVTEPVPVKRVDRLENAISHAISIAKITSVRGLIRFPMQAPPAGSTLDLLANTLQNAKNLVHRNGGRLWFVYLPSYERFARWGTGDDFEGRGRVLQAVRTLGIPVIDVLDPFSLDTNWRTIWAESNVHYSPRGYALAAQAVAEALRAGPRH